MITLDKFFDADLSDVRLGIFKDWFFDSDKVVKEKCMDAVRFLESRGATVVEITIPHLQQMSMSHGIKISSEFAMGWDNYFSNASSSRHMEPNTKITIALGSTMTALEVIAAEKMRAWAFKYVTEELFAKHQLTAIVNPTIGILPPHISEDAKINGESNTPLVVQLMKYIFLANFLGFYKN